MNMKEAAFFLGAAVVAVLIAKVIVYNVANGEKWF